MELGSPDVSRPRGAGCRVPNDGFAERRLVVVEGLEVVRGPDLNAIPQRKGQIEQAGSEWGEDQPRIGRVVVGDGSVRHGARSSTEAVSLAASSQSLDGP